MRRQGHSVTRNTMQTAQSAVDEGATSAFRDQRPGTLAGVVANGLVGVPCCIR